MPHPLATREAPQRSRPSGPLQPVPPPPTRSAHRPQSRRHGGAWGGPPPPQAGRVGQRAPPPEFVLPAPVTAPAAPPVATAAGAPLARQTALAVHATASAGAATARERRKTDMARHRVRRRRQLLPQLWLRPAGAATQTVAAAAAAAGVAAAGVAGWRAHQRGEGRRGAAADPATPLVTGVGGGGARRGWYHRPPQAAASATAVPGTRCRRQHRHRDHHHPPYLETEQPSPVATATARTAAAEGGHQTTGPPPAAGRAATAVKAAATDCGRAANWATARPGGRDQTRTSKTTKMGRRYGSWPRLYRCRCCWRRRDHHGPRCRGHPRQQRGVTAGTGSAAASAACEDRPTARLGGRDQTETTRTRRTRQRYSSSHQRCRRYWRRCVRCGLGRRDHPRPPQALTVGTRCAAVAAACVVGPRALTGTQTG